MRMYLIMSTVSWFLVKVNLKAEVYQILGKKWRFKGVNILLSYIPKMLIKKKLQQDLVIYSLGTEKYGTREPKKTQAILKSVLKKHLIINS